MNLLLFILFIVYLLWLSCHNLYRYTDTQIKLTRIFGRRAFWTVDWVVHRSIFSCSFFVTMWMYRWPWWYISNTSRLNSTKRGAKKNVKKKKRCPMWKKRCHQMVDISSIYTYPCYQIILWSCIATTSLILLVLRYHAQQTVDLRINLASLVNRIFINIFICKTD